MKTLKAEIFTTPNMEEGLEEDVNVAKSALQAIIRSSQINPNIREKANEALGIIFELEKEF